MDPYSKEVLLCIEVLQAYDSLEGFYRGGNKLTLIGVGMMKSPGHPSGNQQFHSQISFLRLLSKEKVLPMYCKRLDGVSIYMGEYSLQTFKKRTSFEGFGYFEYTLLRKPNSLQCVCVGPKSTLLAWHRNSIT